MATKESLANQSRMLERKEKKRKTNKTKQDFK